MSVRLSNCRLNYRPLSNYSPIWLRAAVLFPTIAWSNIYGIVIDVAFFLSLACLPPAHRPRELVFTIAAAISPTVAYAVERANADLVIFILIVAVAGFWVRALPYRIVGYALALVAGLLKFYPLVVLGLAIRERPKVLCGLIALGTTVVVAYVIGFYDELQKAAHNIPGGSYLIGWIGAENLPRGVVTLVSRALRRDLTYVALASWLSGFLWVCLLAAAVSQIVAICRWTEFRRAMAKAPEAAMATTLFGAAVVTGCFFAGQSVAYRGIFLLLLLPGFLTLRRASQDKRVRRFSVLGAALVLVLLWQGPFTWGHGAFDRSVKLAFGFLLGDILGDALWLVREIVWWWLSAILCALLLAFALEKQAGTIDRVVKLVGKR